RKKGLKVGLIEAPEDEVMGINSPEELAEANAIFQKKIRLKFLRQGVSMHDPNSVWFSYDTKIGRNVTIGPNVFFGKNVRIDTGVTIDSFCHMEGVTVGKNSSIGPFSRLRSETRIAANVHVGSFVEIKNAKIAEGAKIPHLSYIGDAVIGSEANIGAGTITCNYDGFEKLMTRIGSKASIGANTSLVAPVKVGDHSVTGAGSTITDDVARHSLALSRLPQYAIKNWSKKNKKSKKKK
ncbi:MAG: bifunctional UDP-N-acetylglucosamine diphosphorylase/glucosamine-1-phosphate N-acetyltransferase GlmU, partial [Rhodospirillales bacterium]|nr:bifunctional UDP-N-acetylglucosamine diphosphorylase/glucosamine-1-phosphate N-acetyltransferase GlmU [Rhodospirillales bacterium]